MEKGYSRQSLLLAALITGLAGTPAHAQQANALAAPKVGAGVPQVLKRAGADPATASSIFLTKATDVVSLAMFLGLAAWLVAR